MSERDFVQPEGMPLTCDEVPIADDAIVLPPAFSDDALAERFSAIYADDLRYVAQWGHWMSWTGQRWQRESHPAIFQRARMISRDISVQADVSDAIKTRLASARTAAAVELESRGDPRHLASAELWDADHWALNTPAGTIELRSGTLRPHSRTDYLSKITMAGPAGDCPLWRKFLARVTDDDEELQAFLRRVIGYCLTGSTSEQALFFLWGTGKNGKSVFLNTVSRLFGDYAKTAPTSTFTANSSEQHPTDLAGLHGARLVTAIETEEGKQWAEAKIKALTGGDPISCRFMRQDYWSYTPIFKLLIASNHKPTIRSVDEAIRRRIHLIPFTVWIPEEERDKDLENKLRAESGGILRWAIDGCLEWQRIGLNPPQVVLDATKEYLDAEDVIARWIDESCLCGRQYATQSTALFKGYKQWCENTGEKARSQKKLTQLLIERGFKPEHTRTGAVIAGIALRDDVPTDRME